MTRKRRIAAYAIAIAVLLGVFALYAKPQIMVAVSDMIWSCFQ
ncbi:MAG TPA: hypothetical protein VMZ74_17220 [Ramlibacter sp.]|nr:hypothetical protein [Ramlibacter sp.]